MDPRVWRSPSRCCGRPPPPVPPTSGPARTPTDRKSTRLNSSHLGISYAVFCLKISQHTVLTTALGLEPLRDFAQIAVLELVVFFLKMRRPRSSTLFPYTPPFH